MLEAFLIVLTTSILTNVIMFVALRKLLPNVIAEVGKDLSNNFSESFNEGLKETFSEPNVKKAFSILGKQSGSVRANDALRNRTAEKLLEGVPSIGFLLDQLDLTPVEGLQLLQDPLIGGFIQGFIKKGVGGLMQPSSNPGQSPTQYKSEF